MTIGIYVIYEHSFITRMICLIRWYSSFNHKATVAISRQITPTVQQCSELFTVCSTNPSFVRNNDEMITVYLVAQPWWTQTADRLPWLNFRRNRFLFPCCQWLCEQLKSQSGLQCMISWKLRFQNKTCHFIWINQRDVSFYLYLTFERIIRLFHSKLFSINGRWSDSSSYMCYFLSCFV